MNEHHWREIERIFEAAVEHDTTERAAFVQAACAGDEALRREVERLLAADQKAQQIGARFLASPLHSAPDTKLGHYRLRHEIARGGMGAVWLAERADEQFQQQVAIKVMHAGGSSDELQRHFQHERQILADLNHPNIARLLDGGTTADGRPYFVMEYIEGVPLDEYCHQQQLPVRARLQLFRQVCAAVQYAHQHLIIHRDLKPANILVTADGTPKLLDFGVAKLLQPDLTASHHTQNGLTPMTPAYASPEQVRGEKLATASDVYSLGVVLYELLTGQSPYQLTTNTFGELSKAICEQEPLRPSMATKSEVRNHKSEGKRRFAFLPTTGYRLPTTLLKGDLDSIVLMALRKEPSARYSSVEQFSADIQRYLDGLPTLARKGTLAYRAVKYVRRYKVPVAAAALILLSLLGGIGATSHQAQIARAEQAKAEAQRIRAEQALMVADEQRRRAEQALAEVEAERTRAENALTTAEQRRQQAEAARAEANQQRAVAETQRRAAEAERDVAQTQRRRAEAQELSNRQLLYNSRMGLAQQAWNDANISRAREMLLPYLTSSDERDLRGFEWYYLWKLSHQEKKTLPVSGTPQWTGFTPDGRYFTTACRVGEAALMQTEINVLETADWQSARQFTVTNATILVGANDGTVLAHARHGGRIITITSLLTGQRVQTIEGLTGGISCLAFAADARSLVVGYYDGALGLVDLASGQETAHRNVHQTRVFTVAVSPQSKKFLSGSIDGAIHLWDRASDQPVRRLSVGLRAPQNALFSPDGKIIVVTGSGRLTAWNVDTGDKLAELESQGRRMAFSPDGKTLVIGGEDAVVQTEITFLDTVAWTPYKVIRGHGNWIMSLAIAPAGESLVSGSLDRSVKLWDIRPTGNLTAINDQQRREGEFVQVALSADGKRLITGQHKQSAVVWDMETGKEIAFLRGHQPWSVGDEIATNRSTFAVAISPQGDKYATGGRDGQVIIWDAATNKELRRFTSPSRISALQFTPDGQSLATVNSGSIIRWGIGPGKLINVIPHRKGTVVAIRFTPDGRRLYSAGPDPFVRVWDTASGQLQRELRCGESNLFSFALSADEETLVTGGADGIARLWDIQTGQARGVLKGHASAVSAVAISPDGKRVVTGSYDRTVRIWDIKTAQELISFRNHNSWICLDSIAFSADGRLLMTAGMDRVAKLWAAATAQEVEASRR
jgi:WD40 repeat protein/serine/threonine protein kinase